MDTVLWEVYNNKSKKKELVGSKTRDKILARGAGYSEKDFSRVPVYAVTDIHGQERLTTPAQIRGIARRGGQYKPNDFVFLGSAGFDDEEATNKYGQLVHDIFREENLIPRLGEQLGRQIKGLENYSPEKLENVRQLYLERTKDNVQKNRLNALFDAGQLYKRLEAGEVPLDVAMQNKILKQSLGVVESEQSLEKYEDATFTDVLMPDLKEGLNRDSDAQAVFGGFKDVLASPGRLVSAVGQEIAEATGMPRATRASFSARLARPAHERDTAERMVQELLDVSNFIGPAVSKGVLRGATAGARVGNASKPAKALEKLRSTLYGTEQEVLRYAGKIGQGKGEEVVKSAKLLPTFLRETYEMSIPAILDIGYELSVENGEPISALAGWVAGAGLAAGIQKGIGKATGKNTYENLYQELVEGGSKAVAKELDKRLIRMSSKDIPTTVYKSQNAKKLLWEEIETASKQLDEAMASLGVDVRVDMGEARKAWISGQKELEKKSKGLKDIYKKPIEKVKTRISEMEDFKTIDHFAEGEWSTIKNDVGVKGVKVGEGIRGVKKETLDKQKESLLRMIKDAKKENKLLTSDEVVSLNIAEDFIKDVVGDVPAIDDDAIREAVSAISEYYKVPPKWVEDVFNGIIAQKNALVPYVSKSKDFVLLPSKDLTVIPPYRSKSKEVAKVSKDLDVRGNYPTEYRPTSLERMKNGKMEEVWDGPIGLLEGKTEKVAKGPYANVKTINMHSATPEEARSYATTLWDIIKDTGEANKLMRDELSVYTKARSAVRRAIEHPLIFDKGGKQVSEEAANAISEFYRRQKKGFDIKETLDYYFKGAETKIEIAEAEKRLGRTTKEASRVPHPEVAGILLETQEYVDELIKIIAKTDKKSAERLTRETRFFDDEVKKWAIQAFNKRNEYFKDIGEGVTASQGKSPLTAAEIAVMPARAVVRIVREMLSITTPKGFLRETPRATKLSAGLVADYFGKNDYSGTVGNGLDASFLGTIDNTATDISNYPSKKYEEAKEGLRVWRDELIEDTSEAVKKKAGLR